MRVFHHYAADEDSPERWKVLETDAATRQAETDRFELFVKASLDELPAQFLRWLEECPVVISEDGAKFGAYGLYVGATIARPEHAAKIFIFRDTLTRDFGHNEALLAQQVRRVVRHELGHHLGFDEDGVAALGL
ncbi:MAG: metallopeptidase family protein [Solirubrobacteraceae bacterium]|nr:metallopeptidase family protein [Solirubrobacteraceae bacterium]